MRKKLLILFLVSMMVLTTALTGCGKKEEAPADNTGNEAPADSKEGGVLTLALSQPPKNLDPISYTGVYEGNVIRQIGNTMVNYDKDLQNIIPGIATEWEASEDLTQYKFTIRDDVYFQPGKFQDGRKMTAEDIKYSLERSAKESAMNRLRMLDSIEIVSETEIIAHLNTPAAQFLTVLTDAGNIIVPKEEVEGWGDEFGLHLVGTGPFSLKEWRMDDAIELVRNDKYWGGKPNLDGVTFKFITDTNMRANALRTGEIDIATDLQGETIEAIRKDENLQIAEVPGMRVSYMYMNTVKGPTADKKVREAIISAINVEELVKGVYPWGEAQRAYLSLPPGSWGYDASLEDIVPKYDPERAKELLAEAGYPNGGFELNLYITNAPLRVKAATIIQSYLKENLNIDVKVHTSEWGTFSEIASSNSADIYGMSWSWYPDPDFFLYQMFHSAQIGALGNGQGFNNKEVDELLNRAISETADQEERAKLYKEALKIITQEHTRIDYSNEKVIYGMSNKVKDFNVSPDSQIFLVHPEFNVYLEK